MFVVSLAGIPVRRDAVLELGGLLDDADDETAEASPPWMSRKQPWTPDAIPPGTPYELSGASASS